MLKIPFCIALEGHEVFVRKIHLFHLKNIQGGGVENIRDCYIRCFCSLVLIIFRRPRG